MSDYPGYRDPALSVLQKHGVRVWSHVIIETHDGKFEGVILPRAEIENPYHIILKVENGYNIGIHVQRIGLRSQQLRDVKIERRRGSDIGRLY